MSTSLGIDYSQLQNEYLQSNRYIRNYNANTTCAAPSSTSSVSAQGGVDTFSTSQETGNTCTDGSDDGKIGFFSKAWSVIKGIGKTAVNMVKEAVKHPFKTALMIGACCIPVVGPFIGGAIAAYGVYSGAKTIAQGIEAANNATTDAEAKDAWENIGGGALTVGTSALALKGSVGLAKHQLQGGSSTVQAVKAARSENAGTGTIMETAVREGVSETARNIGSVAKGAKDKTWEKGKDFVDDCRNDGIVKTAESRAKGLAESAGKKAKNIGEKYDNYKANKEAKAAKAEGAAKTANKNLEKLQNGEAPNGGKIIEDIQGGGWKVETNKGVTVEYNSQGYPTKSIKQANGSTIEITYKKGVKQQTTTTAADGTVTTVDHIKNTEIVKNSEGEVISKKTKNNQETHRYEENGDEQSSKDSYYRRKDENGNPIQKSREDSSTTTADGKETRRSTKEKYNKQGETVEKNYKEEEITIGEDGKPGEVTGSHREYESNGQINSDRYGNSKTQVTDIETMSSKDGTKITERNRTGVKDSEIKSVTKESQVEVDGTMQTQTTTETTYTVGNDTVVEIKGADGKTTYKVNGKTCEKLTPEQKSIIKQAKHNTSASAIKRDNFFLSDVKIGDVTIGNEEAIALAILNGEIE